MSPISVQIGQAVLPLELPPVPLALPLDVVPELPDLLEQPRQLSANKQVTREILKSSLSLPQPQRDDKSFPIFCLRSLAGASLSARA